MRQVARKALTTPDFYLVPIRDLLTAPYDGNVYNLEVEGEHNYLANFALVANCQNWVTSQALRDPASALAGASRRRSHPGGWWRWPSGRARAGRVVL